MSGKGFPGQHEQEHIVFSFQKHWTEVIYPLGRFGIESLLIFMVAAFMYFNSNSFVHTFEGRSMSIIIVVALVVTMLTFWVRMFNYFLRIVIVTDHRIVDVKQQLFVAHDEDVIDFYNVQDVKAETHGLFNNLLQCGSLTFVLSASSLPKILHRVAHPHIVSKKISEVKESYSYKSGTPKNNKQI